MAIQKDLLIQFAAWLDNVNLNGATPIDKVDAFCAWLERWGLEHQRKG